MQTIHSTKSFARLWRQLVFVPCMNRHFCQDSQQKLTLAVSQAEMGHDGEICLVIENHLPILDAYHVGCRERALTLFATQRVWDTEQNTGVLIYANVCEHELHIIADRGIDERTDQAVWQAMIEQALQTCKQEGLERALLGLVATVGEQLRTHYAADVMGNELPDDVVLLGFGGAKR